LDFDAVAIRIVQEETVDPGDFMLKLPRNVPSSRFRVFGGLSDVRNPDAEVPGADRIRLRLLQQVQDVGTDLKPGAGKVKTRRAWNFDELKHTGKKVPRTRKIVGDDRHVIDMRGAKSAQHEDESTGKTSVRPFEPYPLKEEGEEKMCAKLTLPLEARILSPVGYLPPAWNRPL
jgi:hypothetical protein